MKKAGKAKKARPRSPRTPSEQLPEVFGAQFLRFLPGLEASGQSETRVASEEEKEETEETEELEGSSMPTLSYDVLASPAESGGRSSLCSVPVASVRSASSFLTDWAVGSPSLESGPLQNPSMDSLADRWETRFLRRSTRAITTMRDSRILGVPVAYYALLLGSFTFCVASYTFAAKSMPVVGAMTIGEGHVYAKKESGGLLRAPAVVSPTRAFLTTTEYPETVKAVKRRRHGRHRAGSKKRRHGTGRRSPRVRAPLRRSTTAVPTTAAEDSWEDATTWEAEDYWDPGLQTVPTEEESTWVTTQDTPSSTRPPPSTVTTTTTTSTPPTPPSTVTTTTTTSTPPTPPSTVTGGGPTRDKTFLNSSDLYDYEEVFEYYYVYDDNQTWKSKPPRAERRTIDPIE